MAQYRRIWHVRSEAAIRPSSERNLARIGAEQRIYYPAAQQITRWTRRVTFTMGGEELHLDFVDDLQGTDTTGDFINAVLQALSRQRGPPSGWDVRSATGGPSCPISRK